MRPKRKPAPEPAPLDPSNPFHLVVILRERREARRRAREEATR